MRIEKLFEEVLKEATAEMLTLLAWSRVIVGPSNEAQVGNSRCRATCVLAALHAHDICRLTPACCRRACSS